MISNQVLQSSIDSLKGIARLDIAIADIDGKVLATTFLEDKDLSDMVVSFAASQADSQAAGGYQFFKIFDDNQLEYILIARGASEDVYMVGKLAAFQVENLLTAYKERFDRDNFIKNLLLDNLLLIDIYNRAKKLQIEEQARRVCFVIETEAGREMSALETVRNIYANRGHDFVTAVDGRTIILVREVREGESFDELDHAAREVIEGLRAAEILEVNIAYGTIVKDIKDVSRSYKEAMMAREVGKIFYPGQTIVAYNKLGIGRLIYQLPSSLCKMFISEIFEGKTPEQFDEETLQTINKFFENSLNVSETSRQLYIHRNTLVYRLDKLQKTTGLDLRVFEDAITFKIALMVVKYMNSKEEVFDGRKF